MAVARCLHLLACQADRLERRFRAWLSDAGHEAAQADALVAITPAAQSPELGDWGQTLSGSYLLSLLP